MCTRGLRAPACSLTIHPSSNIYSIQVLQLIADYFMVYVHLVNPNAIHLVRCRAIR
jgi:hypothetical protein